MSSHCCIGEPFANDSAGYQRRIKEDIFYGYELVHIETIWGWLDRDLRPAQNR